MGNLIRAGYIALSSYKTYNPDLILELLLPFNLLWEGSQSVHNAMLAHGVIITQGYERPFLYFFFDFFPFVRFFFSTLFYSRGNKLVTNSLRSNADHTRYRCLIVDRIMLINWDSNSLASPPKKKINRSLHQPMEIQEAERESGRLTKHSTRCDENDGMKHISFGWKNIICRCVVLYPRKGIRRLRWDIRWPNYTWPTRVSRAHYRNWTNRVDCQSSLYLSVVG